MKKDNKKELPWYKCKPVKRLKGAIQFCGYGAKGLFSDICDMYWLRECVMTMQELERRFKEPELIKELIDNDVIKVRNGNVIIEFLIEQYEKESGIKIAQSEGGKDGADKRWNKDKAKEKAPAKKQEQGTDFFYIGIDRISQKPSDYIKEHHAESINVWLMQQGIQDRSPIDIALDKECNGQPMTSDKHVVNTFKLIARNNVVANTSPYTADQIAKAKGTLSSDGYVPEWFDKKYLHLLK